MTLGLHPQPLLLTIPGEDITLLRGGSHNSVVQKLNVIYFSMARH